MAELLASLAKLATVVVAGMVIWGDFKSLYYKFINDEV